MSNSWSALERRETAKPNGAVLCKVRTRSELGMEKRRFSDDVGWFSGLKEWFCGVNGVSLGMMSLGTSHLWCLASVIRIRRRSAVS